MKQINDFILEMSALHNRKNDEIYKEIDRIKKDKLEKLYKEIEKNSSDDKERILAAAGVTSTNKRKTEIYDYAMELVKNIMSAKKPYGAILFLLAHVKECMDKYKEKYSNAKDASEALEKILISDAIDKLINGDNSFSELQKKIDLYNDKSNKRSAEMDELISKMKKIENKYEAIKFYNNI